MLHLTAVLLLLLLLLLLLPPAASDLSLDPESSIFLRGDTIFIPACFISWNGSALDEKTPLHRATQAMSHQVHATHTHTHTHTIHAVLDVRV